MAISRRERRGLRAQGAEAARIPTTDLREVDRAEKVERIQARSEGQAAAEIPMTRAVRRLSSMGRIGSRLAWSVQQERKGAATAGAALGTFSGSTASAATALAAGGMTPGLIAAAVGTAAVGTALGAVHGHVAEVRHARRVRAKYLTQRDAKREVGEINTSPQQGTARPAITSGRSKAEMERGFVSIEDQARAMDATPGGTVHVTHNDDGTINVHHQ